MAVAGATDIQRNRHGRWIGGFRLPSGKLDFVTSQLDDVVMFVLFQTADWGAKRRAIHDQVPGPQFVPG